MNTDMAFHALADATRRAVIIQLSQGDASVTELAEPFDISLPSFMKHIKVLEGGGLISTQKKGRTRMCRLEPDRLAQLSGWIDRYEQGWRNRLDRLEIFLNEEDE